MPKYTQYGRPPTCLFITHNMHFPNFSYSNFRQCTRRYTECQMKKIREYIYIGIAAASASATPVQLNFLPMVFVALYAANARIAVNTRPQRASEKDRENPSNECRLFVRFALLFALHWKYIFT